LSLAFVLSPGRESTLKKNNDKIMIVYRPCSIFSFVFIDGHEMIRFSELDTSVCINIVTLIVDFGLTERRDCRIFKLNVTAEVGKPGT
jgi:hypothetical protein